MNWAVDLDGVAKMLTITRKQSKCKKYKEAGGNDHRGTYRNRTIGNYRCVNNNRAEWGKKLMAMAISMGIRILLIIRGRPLSQVTLLARNSPPSELKFGDVGKWESDSEIEDYLVNLIVSNEYRGAVRSEGCDVSKTYAGTNFTRGKWIGKKERVIKRLGSHL